MADLSPLETLNEAVQAFANTQAEHAPLVDVALVIWEEVTFIGDETARRIRYAVPTDNFSLSSGLGLIEAAKTFVRRDTLHDDSEDE